jgi:hypothetical protein
VLVVVVFVVFVGLVVLLSRRAPRSRVQVRSCCSGRPWPPTDLTDPEPRRDDRA